MGLMFFMFSMAIALAERVPLKKVQIFSAKQHCRLLLIFDGDVEEMRSESLPPFEGGASRAILLIEGVDVVEERTLNVNRDGLFYLDLTNTTQVNAHHKLTPSVDIDKKTLVDSNAKERPP